MANVCLVSGTILNLDGTPNTNIQVVAAVESTDDDQGGQLLDNAGVTQKHIEAFTDDNGLFQINLLQGARVLLHIPEINLRKLITVPLADEANFEDLV